MSEREPRHAVVGYPGGLRARYSWGNSDMADAVFALSEAGGSLEDLGPLVSESPDRLCRAELRLDGPAGSWTARLASVVFDEPAGLYWDTEGLLVVKYGFLAYAFEARGGAVRWTHRSATPLVAVLGSPRLDHVIVQSEIETFAIDASGDVVWRLGHSDVVVAAELVGGRLVLTSVEGHLQSLDPRSGLAEERAGR